MKFLSLVTLLAFASAALAAQTPTQFRTDSILWGKSGSTANKSLLFDFGLGASNPSLFSDNATNALNYNKNIFNLGDGTSALKKILANTGGSPAPAISFNSTNGDWEFSNDGTNFSSFGSGSGSGAGINILANPGFETGVSQGWTNTGGTFAPATGSNILIGRGSAAFTASATGQSFQSTLTVIPNGLYGQPCAASMLYLGGSSNLTFEVLDGSSNVLATQVLTAATVPTTVSVPLICPSSGSMQVVVSSSAASALLAADQMTLGTNPLSQVAQSQLLGAVSISGCAAPWSNTTTSFSAFAAQTGCVYTTVGSAQAPGSMIPAITFPSIPAGELILQYEGTTESTTQSHSSYFQFTDGTNVARETSVIISSAGGTIESNGLFQSIKYTTPQSNVTLQIYSKVDSGGTARIYSTAVNPGVIKVYFFPASPNTAVNVAQVPASWSGYQINTGGWISTSGTPVDPTAGAGITLTQTTNRNFGTVTSAAGSLPGVAWTPPVAGIYHVAAPVVVYENGAGNPFVRLVDGSGTIIDPGRYTTSNNTDQTVPLQGDYLVTNAGVPITFKLQLAFSGGTSAGIGAANLGAAIQWTISNADFNSAVPVFPGSVTSSSAGVLRLESARFGGSTVVSSCTSSPCTIYAGATPAITSVTRSGTGVYQALFSAGTFSVMPTCTCTQDFAGTNGPCLTDYNSSTTTSVQFRAINGSNVAADNPMSITCIGSH